MLRVLWLALSGCASLCSSLPLNASLPSPQRPRAETLNTSRPLSALSAAAAVPAALSLPPSQEAFKTRMTRSVTCLGCAARVLVCLEHRARPEHDLQLPTPRPQHPHLLPRVAPVKSRVGEREGEGASTDHGAESEVVRDDGVILPTPRAHAVSRHGLRGMPLLGYHGVRTRRDALAWVS